MTTFDDLRRKASQVRTQIDPAVTLTRSEKAAILAGIGVPGPAGPTGATGPAGPTGPTGPTGGAAYAHARVGGSNFALANSTSVQRIFNVSTNGALTMETGRFYFVCRLRLIAMSATLGNAAFHLLGAGTATLGEIQYMAQGSDDDAAADPKLQSASFTATQDTADNMIVGGTGTQMFANIEGMFQVSGAGTIIPSVALRHAAAASVQVGTFMTVWKLGDSGLIGTWT